MVYPCRDATLHYADPAIQNGVFDFDISCEDVNDYYNLMDWATLDLSASGYEEIFDDQSGSCPEPILTADSFTLTWESYQDSTDILGVDSAELE